MNRQQFEEALEELSSFYLASENSTQTEYYSEAYDRKKAELLKWFDEMSRLEERVREYKYEWESACERDRATKASYDEIYKRMEKIKQS